MKIDWKKLIFSLALPFIIGFIGSYFTASSVSGWYLTIQKPHFSPPNWVFGPVWTLLYILMGISLYIILTSKSAEKDKALYWFSAQLFFNFAWSAFFFGMMNPFLAFIDIIILWACIALTILKFSKISRKSAYLLIPYILWVSFAAVLNLAIVLLN